MHGAWTILRKDLRLRLRDRSVLLYAIVVPLGLTMLFSAILPDDEGLELTAGVVDEDGGEVAAGFVDGVLPALEDEGIVTLVDLVDEADGRERLEAGDLDAVWVVPSGFSEAVTSGQATDLEVLVNADRALSGEVARSIAESYATRLEGVALAVATTATAAGGDLDEAALAEVSAAASDAEPVVRVAAAATEDRRLDSSSYLAAGMAAFFVFFTVQFGVTGLLEEQQVGTMPRLLAAPIPPLQIHLGKVLGAALVGLVSMTVLLTASSVLLDASFGAPLGVAALVLAIVVSAIGVMALVGSFARTSEQASNYQTIVAVVLGMLGGVFFPVPFTGGLARAVSAASPHRWFLQGMSDLSGGGDWTVVLPAVGALVAFGLVAAVPAVWRLRRATAW